MNKKIFNGRAASTRSSPTPVTRAGVSRLLVLANVCVELHAAELYGKLAAGP